MRVFETKFNFKPSWKHTSYLKFDISAAASNKGIHERIDKIIVLFLPLALQLSTNYHMQATLNNWHFYS